MSRHFGARLREYLVQGYRAVSLENELLRVELLLDKGSDIITFLHKPSDIDVLWRSSVGLRDWPYGLGRVSADESGFIEGYEGGWQECLPNGGPGVTYRGAPLPFHGEVWRLPWSSEVIEDRPEVVSVRLVARTLQTPFRIEKTLTLRSGRAVLEIDERLTNESPVPSELMWGHHPAFGLPFLDESCRIDLPPCRGTTRRAERIATSQLAFPADFDWPNAPLEAGGTRDISHVPPPDSGTSEWVCLSGFEQGWYGITSGRRKVGFGLRWDASLFKHLWFWQVWGGAPDWPWYGRHYNCALEPWTSWPDGGLLKAMENGSALHIDGGQTIETRLLAVAYDGRDGIGGITSDGDVE